MVTVGTLLAAAFMFLLPGFVLNVVAGVRVPVAVAAALPVTFGLVGFSAWMWGVTSARFSPWTFWITVVLALLAAAAWRYAFARRARRGGQVSWRRALFVGQSVGVSWVLPAVGVVGGVVMLVKDRLGWLAEAPLGFGNIVQGWDVQWHANLVRFIMDEGVASATRMGELQNIETQSDLLYPSAYHAGVALFAQLAGLEPIEGLNIAATLLPAVAVCVSMACLVLVFLRSDGLTAQIAAGLAPVLVYAMPQVMWVADYVGMWPYLFAVGLSGTVIWMFAVTLQRHAVAFSTAWAFLGVLTVHPSAVSIVAIGVGLFWLVGVLVRPVQSRVRDTVWLGLPAVAASVCFLPQVFAGSEQAEEVANWSTPEDAGTASAFDAGVLMQTRHVLEFFPNYDPTVLLVLAVIGALALVLWRGQVWPLLFYVVAMASVVNVYQPFSGPVGGLLSAVGSLHYNTAHRLVLPEVFAVVACAAIGVAVIIRVLTLAPLAARKAVPGLRRVSSAVALVVAVVVGVAAMPWARAQAQVGAQAAYLAPRVSQRMVDEDDVAVFDWLSQQPAAFEGLTMGEPSDGHSWIYAYAGVPTVSRHYQWPHAGRGKDTSVLYWQSNQLGEGVFGDADALNVADEAAERMNVKFYLISPPSFWHFQLPRSELLEGAWMTRGLTPVFRKGATAVFAVNEQFSKGELKALVESGRRAGSDELFELESASATPALAVGYTYW